MRQTSRFCNWLSCPKVGQAQKFDVFYNASSVFEKTWEVLGLSVQRKQRHPLSYLTEAADDICYRVLDFEDAVISGVVPLKHVANIMAESLQIVNKGDLELIALSKLRSRMIRCLINDFAECFKSNYQDIMSGSFYGELREHLAEDTKSKRYLEKVDDVYKEIYTERTKVIVECGAYSQIPIVLGRGYEFIQEAFNKSNSGENCLPEFKRLSHFAQQFIVLAWGQDFYDFNRHCSFDWWMHALLDYVVGMTDAYINMLSQKLNYCPGHRQ